MANPPSHHCIRPGTTVLQGHFCQQQRDAWLRRRRSPLPVHPRTGLSRAAMVVGPATQGCWPWRR